MKRWFLSWSKSPKRQSQQQDAAQLVERLLCPAVAKRGVSLIPANHHNVSPDMDILGMASGVEFEPVFSIFAVTFTPLTWVH